MRTQGTKAGFTLLEMVFVLILVGIVASMAVSLLVGASDAERYELTRRKLDLIRNAILGAPQVDAQGRRIDYGYHGDFGELPPSLTALTVPQAPAWTFHSALGFGAGWRGPYYKPDFPDPYPISHDGWGNPFVYGTASVTSYGKDGAPGGSVYDQDLVLSLTTAARLARVRGMVKDGSTGLPSRVVRLLYPAAGVVTTASATTDANGFFDFSGIPFGQRAVLVTNAPAVGPKPAFVDAPETLLPPDTLNYFGSVQKVTVNTATAACAVGDKFHHRVQVNNSYLTAVTAGFITVWWENTSRRLNTIALNAVSESVGSLTSGTRITVTKNLGIPAGSAATFELRWNGKVDSADVAAEFEWNGIADRDQIAWITSTCANPAIAANNPLSASFTNKTSSTTMAYTVGATVNNPTLVVVAGGTDATDNIIPTGATFGGTPMNLATAIVTGTAGTRSAVAMWWLAVAPSQSGNITVNYPANASHHTLLAYALNSTDQTGPEAVAAYKTDTATTTGDIATLSSDAFVATGGQAAAGSAMAASGSVGGPTHVLDKTANTGSTSGAMGHVSAPSPTTLKSVGFAVGGGTNMGVVMGSFRYTP